MSLDRQMQIQKQLLFRVGCTGWPLSPVRHYSNGIATVPLKDYLTDPVKMIVIPVTTKKAFIYHKHTRDILNDNSRLIKLERWITRKAENIWEKLNTSPKSYNKKIVSWVNMLLMNTPWTENSLKTIPGENYILKRVSKKDKGGNEEESKLTLKEYLSSDVPLQSRPLNVYFPGKLLSKHTVVSELQSLYKNGIDYHKKHTILCLLGIPLTIPVILVPIIPNVPGFYLTYRAYCNFKAFLGAKHLRNIMENHIPTLQFKDVEGYDEIISNGEKNATGKDQEKDQTEKLILNNENLPRILDLLEIREIRMDLEKVINQEQGRLKNLTHLQRQQ